MIFRGILSPLALATGVATSAIGGALILQHFGGLQPCLLCLEQRTPYYVAVPMLLIALTLRLVKTNIATALSLLLTCVSIVLFAWGIDMAGYHAGAEWGFWPGPQSCAQGPQFANQLDAYIAKLKATAVIDCTKPAMVFLGLSLAGWNVVALVSVIALLLWSAKRTADEILRGIKSQGRFAE